MRTFFSAILAGAFIGLGGMANITTDSQIVGAVLFSIGLLTILAMDLRLYTGCVAYFWDAKLRWSLLDILAGNLLGAWVMGWLYRISGLEARDVITPRTSHNALNWLVLAFLCGMCIYIGVEAWKASKPLITALSVVVFVACGFEHCVADMFYFTATGWRWIEIWWMVLAVIGNAGGGIATHYLKKLSCEWLDG